ncbi:MAG: right-handed parallel beta-helix repeat-containing protein [Planctomycetes bacterium]|nr:right-handed parallel beta-helix repeat-containing protein [Planctomycetota bacterium]
MSTLRTLAIPLLASAALAQTPVVHVAPDGDDARQGSATAPLRSLARARDRLRELRSAAAPPVGGEVVLHAGTWHLGEPLRLDPADGGTAAASVTWRAADGAAVTISGGRRLAPVVAAADGRLTAPLGGLRPRELFVDGARRPRARTPDTGFLRVVAAAPDRRSGFSFEPGAVAAVDDVTAVELVFLHDWSVSRIGLASLDPAAGTLVTRDPIGAAAAHYAIDNFEPHPRFWLEGSPRFLDAPGEWCVDAAADTLVYAPLPGEDPAAIELVVPVAPALLDVRGDEIAPVCGLHFAGIRFAHAAWQPPAHGYAEGQATFHEPRTAAGGDILRQPVPPALHFERAVDCSLRDCEISHLGTAGVRFGSRTARCELRDCVVDDVAGNGVMIGEDGHRTVDGRPWWQAAPEQAASDTAVVGCTIARCGQQFFGAVGIWVGFARGARITRNELRDLPYTGVSLGWRWNPEPTPVRDLLVADNHIHHVMQVLSDGGGIYTLGLQPGTVLSGNRIHDVPVNLGRAESNGMFLDEGTTGILVEGNVIWNVARAPLRFHRATRNLVRANLLVLRGDNPPVRYNATDPALIELIDNVVARTTDD